MRIGGGQAYKDGRWWTSGSRMAVLVAVRRYVIMLRNVISFVAENRRASLGAKYHLFMIRIYIVMWSRGLRGVSATAHLLGLRVRIPPGTWMFVSCECRVCFRVEVSATGRSLVLRSPTEYGVSSCDLESSTMRGPRPMRAVEPWKNWRRCHLTNNVQCLPYVYFTRFKIWRTVKVS
jgi:hypothetical protein